MDMARSRLSLLNISVTYFLLIIGSIIMLFPFFWMVLTSFKTFPETLQVPIVWFPETWSLDNYVEVLREMNFLTYYKNSIIVTVTGVSLCMFFCSLAAYTFARMRFFGKDVLFFILLSTFMVPAQMTLIPRFMLINAFGWIDTYQAMIVPTIFSVYTIFMLRQSFINLPREVEDSGKIDGCSFFRLYWNIMLPMAKSGLVAIGVLNVLFSWNNLLWPLIVVNTNKMRVLSIAVAAFHGQYYTKLNLLMAVGVVVTLPMLVLYIIGQRHFISGIAFSGLKG